MGYIKTLASPQELNQSKFLHDGIWKMNLYSNLTVEFLDTARQAENKAEICWDLLRFVIAIHRAANPYRQVQRFVANPNHNRNPNPNPSPALSI